MDLRGISVVSCNSPLPFWHQGLVLWKTVFPQAGVGRGEDGFGMIPVHYIYCVLYFYYYIVICNVIIIQLTIMQNQGEP